MKNLKDFENELNKCSKCGLCQQACPVYKITQNECAVSKGKFIMLHGVTKGELELSQNINHYLDMCTKCGRCRQYCPAGIDVCQIFNIAKSEYIQSTKHNFKFNFIKFFQSNLLFNGTIKFFDIITKPFRPRKQKGENATKIMYFKGCVNRISPQTDRLISKIFKNTPLEIIEPDFDCCGLPFLSEGNMDRFIQAAKDNIKKMDTDFDYLVTDCASCEDTILNYPDYIDNFKIDKGKSINWGDLIVQKNLKFLYSKPVKVTFHKPCHLRDDSFFEQIMRACVNVEYVQMKDYDDCCGLAGSFALKNKDITKEMYKNKAKNIKRTRADYVITTCPACIIGLKTGLNMMNCDTKVVSLLEFLSKADDILN